MTVCRVCLLVAMTRSQSLLVIAAGAATPTCYRRAWPRQANTGLFR
jgi:hypothetical protein